MRVSRAKSGASPNKPEEALNLCAVLFKLSVRVYTAGSLLSSLFNACICECGRQNTRQSKEQKTAAETFISWCILPVPVGCCKVLEGVVVSFLIFKLDNISDCKWVTCGRAHLFDFT